MKNSLTVFTLELNRRWREKQGSQTNVRSLECILILPVDTTLENHNSQGTVECIDFGGTSVTNQYEQSYPDRIQVQV